MAGAITSLSHGSNPGPPSPHPPASRTSECRLTEQPPPLTARWALNTRMGEALEAGGRAPNGPTPLSGHTQQTLWRSRARREAQRREGGDRQCGPQAARRRRPQARHSEAWGQSCPPEPWSRQPPTPQPPKSTHVRRSPHGAICAHGRGPNSTLGPWLREPHGPGSGPCPRVSNGWPDPLPWGLRGLGRGLGRGL